MSERKFIVVGGSFDGEYITPRPDAREFRAYEWQRESRKYQKSEFATKPLQIERYIRESIFVDREFYDFYRFEKLSNADALKKVFAAYADKSRIEKTSEKIFDETEIAGYMQRAEKATFFGEPIKDLSRETLIAALLILGEQVESLRGDVSNVARLNKIFRIKKKPSEE